MKTIPITPITKWSFSRLSVFEQCKLRAKLQYVDKIPEPERPLPPGKTEHYNDRGTRVHNEAEMYVRGKGDIGREMEKFRPEFEALRRMFKNGMVCLEDEWCTDDEWNPVNWNSKEAWQRLKVDALAFLSDQEAVVIDYKTGKRFGNEVKHAEQTQLYQLNTFLRYPKLEVIHTELWYLDIDELITSTYTRSQGLRFRANWDRRGKAITSATAFPANPNIFSCKHCPYGPDGTGHCLSGVRKG